MADLLFGGFGVMPVSRRKERRFSLPDNFSISDYTDDELRSRYRFGRESIAFLVDILREDLESISNPFNPENPGVSSRISMSFSLAWEGCFGAGPPPLFFCFSLKSGKFFFYHTVQILPLVFNFLYGSIGTSNGVNSLCNFFP